MVFDELINSSIASIISLVRYSNNALLYPIILKRTPTKASVKGAVGVTKGGMRRYRRVMPFRICYKGEGLRAENIGGKSRELRG